MARRLVRGVPLAGSREAFPSALAHGLGGVSAALELLLTICDRDPQASSGGFLRVLCIGWSLETAVEVSPDQAFEEDTDAACSAKVDLVYFAPDEAFRLIGEGDHYFSHFYLQQSLDSPRAVLCLSPARAWGLAKNKSK